MRVQYPTIRLNLGATLGLALAAAMVTVSVPAQAEESVPLDTKIIRNLLQSLGLKRPDQEGIVYQERAPLVIPPAQGLPTPQTPGAAIANNPAWPKDPDIARARVRAAMERDRDTTAEIMREENPLSPSELAPGPRPSRQAGNPIDRIEAGRHDYDRVLTPAELGYRGGIFTNMFSSKNDSDNVRFTGPPPRTSLIEPPTAYQLPSPDQPYGLGNARQAPQADQSYITRGEVRE